VLVDQNVATVASLYYGFLCRARIARNDDAAVGRIESISVTLDRVPRRKGPDSYLLICVNQTEFDFMRIDFLPFPVRTLVSAGSCAHLDIDLVGLQEVLGH